MAKPFKRLSVRRSTGSATSCLCGVDSGLSATGFPNPAGSVVRAAQLQLFSRDRSYLEVGGGNLRNALFVQRTIGVRKMVVVEQRSVSQRFDDQYAEFSRRGGVVKEKLPRGRFDVIVLTYVLETICPSSDRENLLGQIVNLMGRDARLILSIRGYPGVRGRYYERCPHSDGCVTPRGAFVRAYSLTELKAFLDRHGLEFTALQRYRCDAPENIHGTAKRADQSVLFERPLY